MKSLIEELKKMDDLLVLTGVSEDEILTAENDLGLHFSKEYKEYLLEFGAASVDGHEFTGIVNSRRLSVVEVTKEEKRKNPNVLIDLYVVEKTNIDHIIVWQNEKGTVYHTQGTSDLVKVCNSLVEYIDME